MNDSLAASRFIVISSVFVSALYFTLVALTNITDLGSNFAFVEHVLDMDTLFSGEALRERAITNPTLHKFFYGMIIAWESLAAGVLWYGASQLSKYRNADQNLFEQAKTYALYGLGIGMLLWFFAFITVGGEYFLMWRSQDWTGVGSAFQMFTVMGIVTILLKQTK